MMERQPLQLLTTPLARQALLMVELREKVELRANSLRQILISTLTRAKGAAAVREGLEPSLGKEALRLGRNELRTLLKGEEKDLARKALVLRVAKALAARVVRVPLPLRKVAKARRSR